MADPTVTIKSDGTAASTEVWVGDRLVPVRAVTWTASNGEDFAVAEIALDVVEVAVVGEAVRWHGLDDVPDEALEAELARRREQP